MSDKIQKNHHTKNSEPDLSDLDASVVQRLESDSDFEARMIANFNAKVNSISHLDVDKVVIDQQKKETGGPAGLEPTRYGDWERKGRCTDF